MYPVTACAWLRLRLQQAAACLSLTDDEGDCDHEAVGQKIHATRDQPRSARWIHSIVRIAKMNNAQFARRSLVLALIAGAAALVFLLCNTDNVFHKSGASGSDSNDVYVRNRGVQGGRRLCARVAAQLTAALQRSCS